MSCWKCWTSWAGRKVSGWAIRWAGHCWPCSPRRGRVRALVLLDSLGLLPGPVEQAAGQWQRAIAGAVRHRRPRPLRVFPRLDDAVAARCRDGALPVPAARALVERGVDPVPGGWSWSSDPRLTLPTPVRMHEAQIRALLAQLRCPLQVLLADPPPSFMAADDLQGRLDCVPQAQVSRISGGHHFHMESPAAVAAAVAAFLARLPTAAGQDGAVAASASSAGGPPDPAA